MKIRIYEHNDKPADTIFHVEKYDFYPDTKLLFAKCLDAVHFIPITDSVRHIEICDGEELGYLEGSDETC